MRAIYKGHTIETEATKHVAGGWTALVHIYSTDGTIVRSSLDLGDVTFASAELADQAALLLGRAWIDRLEPLP